MELRSNRKARKENKRNGTELTEEEIKEGQAHDRRFTYTWIVFFFSALVLWTVLTVHVLSRLAPFTFPIQGSRWMTIVFAAAALVSFVSFFLDRRNGEYLDFVKLIVMIILVAILSRIVLVLGSALHISNALWSPFGLNTGWSLLWDLVGMGISVFFLMLGAVSAFNSIDGENGVPPIPWQELRYWREHDESFGRSFLYLIWVIISYPLRVILSLLSTGTFWYTIIGILFSLFWGGNAIETHIGMFH